MAPFGDSTCLSLLSLLTFSPRSAMLSVGNDANDFTPLNKGAPILRSSVGTNDTRDPQIFRRPRERKNNIIPTDNSLRLPASGPQ